MLLVVSTQAKGKRQWSPETYKNYCSGERKAVHEKPNTKEKLSARTVCSKVSTNVSLLELEPFWVSNLIIQHGLEPIHIKDPDGICIRRMLHPWE